MTDTIIIIKTTNIADMILRYITKIYEISSFVINFYKNKEKSTSNFFRKSFNNEESIIFYYI